MHSNRGEAFSLLQLAPMWLQLKSFVGNILTSACNLDSRIYRAPHSYIACKREQQSKRAKSKNAQDKLDLIALMWLLNGGVCCAAIYMLSCHLFGFMQQNPIFAPDSVCTTDCIIHLQFP